MPVTLDDTTHDPIGQRACKASRADQAAAERDEANRRAAAFQVWLDAASQAQNGEAGDVG